MPACVVPGCENYILSQSIGIPFHRFPRNAEIRRQWLAKVRNQALSVTSSFDKVKNLRVCGKHFLPSDYERDLQSELTGSSPRHILKKDAVPSIFAFAPQREVPLPKRSAFEKREELRRKASQRSLTQDTEPTTSSGDTLLRSGSVTDVSTDTESLLYSSPLKSWSPKSSSPFKPSSSDDMTSETEVSTDSESELQTDTSKVIVAQTRLYELFKRCQLCGEGIISRKSLNKGAKLVILWECVYGHNGRWESCENIRGMPAVNLQIASAIVLSGNTYQSIYNMAHLLNLHLFSKTTFNKIQNTYILPVIDQTYKRQYYENMALLVAKTLEGEGVSLLGDGRSDSPGFSAKYTTYSLMEETTSKIVEMQLVQVTETTSSVAMEKEGFIRSIENILDHGVNVETVTTDRSPSIRKLMRETYSSIQHQFDCWHLCKGVKKKCLASGRKKGHDILLKWTKSVTNHLWYSCSACGGDVVELKRLWHSVLHHVTGVHHWEDEDGTKHSCQHPPLSPEEQEVRMWFDCKSTAYRDLESIVMDTRLNKDLEQLTLFKHTGGLESYHSAMLRFAPKRLHFHYAAMKGRMQLAVLDHKYNTDRGAATTKEGKPVYRYESSKMKGGEWTAKKVSQKKSDNYALEMMADVQTRRRDPSIVYLDKESFVPLPELPRNIAKVKRPPVEVLLAQKHKQ